MRTLARWYNGPYPELEDGWLINSSCDFSWTQCCFHCQTASALRSTFNQVYRWQTYFTTSPQRTQACCVSRLDSTPTQECVRGRGQGGIHRARGGAANKEKIKECVYEHRCPRETTPCCTFCYLISVRVIRGRSLQQIRCATFPSRW